MSRTRPPPNGNGYLNGNSSQHLQRFDFDTSSRDTSADERSRSRGPGDYGGFGESTAPGGRIRAPGRLDRAQANRRSRDGGAWDSSRSPSRPAPMSHRGGTQVEDISRYIDQQWSFMSSQSCIPVKVALQLNDPSSLGLMDQYDQFQETHRQLQNALKVIVNEHHQGFNSSIGTFHTIQAAIHSSQHRVRTLRSGLVAAKGSLATTKPELKAFAQGSQEYDSMLQTLSIIETLQAVPEVLEAEISEKRFLAAVDTLQDALRQIRNPEMEEIGALTDLRVYLSNQEHSLTDILVEELHSHLYLKSPYCEERWKSHARYDSSKTSVAPDQRPLHVFLESFDGTKPMQEDTTRNPEAETFYYIQLLVESLNKMSRLDIAVDAIEQRLPVELFSVVERSHAEVEQRHPNTLRAGLRKRIDALGTKDQAESEEKATLEDLLTTLYAKFEAIAEGHCVLHGVIAAILRRENLLDGPTLNRSFREMWKLLQSEIRSLLHDHLATSGDVSHRGGQANDPGANMFKPQPRDRNRRIFRLTDTDAKSTELATEREDLEFILRASVPGLVNANSRDSTKKQHHDEIMSDRSATGHKMLVEPSIFNMAILLPPSLDFLHRLQEVVPRGSTVVASTLTSFLDDFLVNVFYPQLDETLMDLCSRCLNDTDAFQPDPKWQEHSQRPIFRGVIRFYEIMERVCTMLDALPHDQSFSQLLISQMRTYYDRCFTWSKSLLQRSQLNQEDQPRMRIAAELATSGAIQSVVADLLSPPADTTASALIADEDTALISLAQTRVIEEADLIHDRKALAALCTLHTSMKWLAARTKALAFISPRAIDNTTTSSSTNHHTRRWTNNTSLSSTLPSIPYLPLNAATSEEFEAVTFSFTELSGLILRTLHIDFRLHLLHGVSTSLRKSYVLTQPYTDPDPSILALTSSLATYCGGLETHLLPSQVEYILISLDSLANTALIELVGLVQGMDAHGRERMKLNVLVLQQGFKGLKRDFELGKAGEFWGEAGGDEGAASEEAMAGLRKLVGGS
ncbi:hypothetical protein B0A48_09382 [Cryoendolithus antarcticus]|uniref:Exocyst complex component Sec8 n=1 Tax=Cryoendolithus antarcticus TaxID=1507870 RepID=A0A1V8SZF7_9PEZI|nr:hypothetical protein B0A48_09382 [Cryoendolithus antarcticus]